MLCTPALLAAGRSTRSPDTATPRPDRPEGQSGASAIDREGFQRLVADVSLGEAGIVLGLECSRLARNADWHRLPALCSLSGTLICDEDGLYDPGQVDDRLLLGLKGTISEAELHFIRARLQGGLLAKAARGELRVRLPVGLVYDQLGNVTLDPDAEVRGAVEHLFNSFQQTGSAHAVVKQFAAEQLKFPGRHAPGGPHAGETYWKALRHDLVLFTLQSCQLRGGPLVGHGSTREHRPKGVHERFIRLPRPEAVSRKPDALAEIMVQQCEKPRLGRTLPKADTELGGFDDRLRRRCSREQLNERRHSKLIMVGGPVGEIVGLLVVPSAIELF